MVGIFTGAGLGTERGSSAVLGAQGQVGQSGLGSAGGSVAVNAATGGLTLTRTDEMLIGRGPDQAISLNYDSGTQAWLPGMVRALSALTGIVNTAGSTITLIRNSDRPIFTYDPSRGAYVSKEGAGAYDEIRYSGGAWSFVDGDTQVTENFGYQAGAILRMSTVDRDGNTQTYSYVGATGKVDRITNADGGYTQFTWGSNSRPTEIATYAVAGGAAVTRVRYLWETGTNRLQTVTVDLSPGDNSDTDGKTYVTNYSYHGTGTYIKSIIQSDGSHLEITYDSSNRVKTLAELITTGVTRTTTLDYYTGYTTVTDAQGGVVRLDYDAKNQLTKLTQPPAASTGATAQVTQFEYNANGDVTKVIDALGNFTGYQYDSRGNMLYETDRENNTISRTYGTKNELLTEWRYGSYAWSPAGQLGKRYAYDGEGHLTFAIGAAGEVTEYRYTPSGELEYVIEYPEQGPSLAGLNPTDAVAHSTLVDWRNSLADRSSTKVTKNSYDVRGNLLSTRRYSATSTAGTITSAEEAQDVSSTAYVYDHAGQLLSRTTLGQGTETFVYDGLGRLIETTDRHSGLTKITFKDSFSQTIVELANGYVKTSTYDKTGNVLNVTESGSFIPTNPIPTTHHKYDKLGRLRMTTDAAGFSKYFVYDKVGRLIAEVNHRGDLIEYRYDANNRLVATGRHDAPVTGQNLLTLADPDSTIEMSTLRPPWAVRDIWTWTTYDKEGRVTSTIDGTIRTYEYDASGRLVKTMAYYNGLTWEQLVAFQTNPPTVPFIPAPDPLDTVARTFYDPEGHVAGTLDAEGYLTYNLYDLAGQLVFRKAYFNPSHEPSRVNGTLGQLLANQYGSDHDRFTRYSYDSQGLLRYEIDAHNQVVEYGYNAARQLISTVRYAGSIAATSDYTFDNVKALVTASGHAASVDTRRSYHVYHLSGALALSIDAEGGVTGYGYDNVGQVKKTVRFAVAYPTTSAPSLATMEGWALGQASNSSNRVTRHYYNARGEERFTVDGEGYLTRTDYDRAGRVTGRFSWDTPITVNDLSTIDHVDALQTGTWTGKTYGYSFGGQLTHETNGEGNWTHYEYYSTGTLLREYVALPDSSYTHYDYDNYGRVIVRTEAYTTPEQAAVQYDYDGHGNLKKVIDARSKSTIIAHDKLGRVLSETDPLTGIVRYEYNAFGEVTKVTDARGFATISTYDRLGRLFTTTDPLTTVTTHSYNAFGDLRTVTRGAATTEFQYDRVGRVEKSIDAQNHYEEYTLNAFGERFQVRNKLGGLIENTYDRRGLLTHEKLPMASSDVNGVAVATTVTNKFEYDARGNRKKKIEAFNLAEARTTFYDYDKADRLIETRGDSVWVMNADWVNVSVATPTEKLQYDNAGRVILKTDALGGRTFYFYDKLSRVKIELATAGSNSASNYTTYTYDANGNVLTRRAYDATIGTPGGTGDPPPGNPGGSYRETSYDYDALNRLEKITVAGVRTGAWNGTSYATAASVSLITRFQYDANGNVIRTEDGNGISSYAYYDKENRKIAEVDREGYLAFYERDVEGNVLKEDRYASRVTAAVESNPADLRTAAGNADTAAGLSRRTTEFTYDKNGRRLTEKRLNVNAAKLDAVSHDVVADVAHSLIQYSYTELGQVSLKTEANGDFVDYTYDNAGRLIQETRSLYHDHNNAGVNPTVYHFYNGLNELTLTRQGGAAPAAGDRMTRYTYGAGGRVATMSDATYDPNSATPYSGTYTYYYDTAGNVLRESYYRYKADTSFTIDSLLYSRDLLGRVTSQGLASWNGSTWDHGDRQGTAYNAHGDVAQRGLNGGWQEQLSYDTAGRLWKSNSGDGLWRYFVYDGAGNRTLALETEVTELTTYSLDQAIGHGAAGTGGINAAIAVFDQRGQQTGTVLPSRELNASTTQTLTSSRVYNAFGEVTSETDARSAVTNFSYNTMGRLIQKQSPSVNFTDAGGGTAPARPTEKYHYDVSGRMIAADVYSDTVSFNRVRRDLLAGSGHGGSEAIVTYEYHGDGGHLRNAYDVFGDKRVSWDEVTRRTDMSYDALGRLTQMSRPNSLVENYAYDMLGQRTKHWNSLLGAGNVETTNYDMQGRVTRQIAFGGDITDIVHAWVSTHVTEGMGTFGGWTETTTMVSNGRSSTEKTDLFGHLLYKSDLGGHVYEFAYDKAGRMTQRTGGEALTVAWHNTGKVAESSTYVAASATNWSRKKTTYSYDEVGNLKAEKFIEEGHSDYFTYDHEAGYYHHYFGWTRTYKDASANYDNAGRLTSWAEAGSVYTPSASTTYQYDLAGNIRHTFATYQSIDNQGAPSVSSTQEFWYRYDSLNRLVTKGQLSGGQIVRGSNGVDYLYDDAGQRVSATRTTLAGGYYEQHSREDYTYDSGGFLETIRIGQSNYVDSYLPSVGVLRASYINDKMGRVTKQVDYEADGVTAVYDRTAEYNAKSQVWHEAIAQKQGSDTLTSDTTNEFGSGSTYALGAVTFSTSHNYKLVGTNNIYQHSSTVSTSYAWYDGAVQSQILSTPNATYQPTVTTSTYFGYDGVGNLTAISIGGSRAHDVSFLNDSNGQAIKRDEGDSHLNAGDPHEIWHRFGGKQMGHVGNNGTLDTDYATSIANRATAPLTGQGAFRFGATSGSSQADFDLSGDALTSYSQGVSAGAYTVRQGDTLETVAAQLWGDSSLWYKLAEANGMSAANGLVEGQRLTIPAGVVKNHHNASTFKPYDPAETLGDLNPATPQPQKGKRGGKCGMFGVILLVAVAIAVTALAGPAIIGAPAILGAGGAVTTAATGLTAVLGGAAAAAGSAAAIGAGIIGGALAGAAGSLVSQGFGLATGLQDKFSWKGVALSAISGGVSGGLDGLSHVGSFAFLKGGSIAADAARGVVSNGIGQGIGVVTGLQRKFDFAGIAAAGLVGAVNGAVSRALPNHATAATATEAGRPASFLNGQAAVTAGLISGAAARSLINGTDFGDNVMAVLPDAIGMTLGNAFVHKVVSSWGKKPLQFAQAEIPRPRGDVVMSDAIIITGFKMSGWEKFKHDVKQALDDTGTMLRAQAEQSNLVVLMRLGAIAADQLGLRPVSQVLTHGANFTVGFQVGGQRTVLDMVRGVGSAFAHPINTGVALGRGAAGFVDTALMSNPGDVRNFVASKASAAWNTVASGDSMRIGEAFGSAAVTVADIAIGSHGVGTASRVVRIADAAPSTGSPALFSRGAGIERASPGLVQAIASRRSVTWATPGSDAARYLDARGAEAVSFNAQDIILRSNPSKAAALEEFLHGTQHRLGIVDRLGYNGLGSAETHVKDFMIRHQRMLGLSDEDTALLKLLRDKGL